MSLYIDPVSQPVDAQGDPYPGAVVYFYLAGTTTPASVYADAALTTALGTSVTASANGQFPPIYLDDSVTYRRILRDASGTQLRDHDNIRGIALSASAVGAVLYPTASAETSAGVTPTNKAYPVGHVKRYGAAVDNSTDDTTAINNACTVVSTQGGGKVWGFAGGSSVTTAPIIVKEGVELDGEGGRIRATLSSQNDMGTRLMSYATIRNITVQVESSGTVASQGAAHSAIVVGPLYGEGGTPTALSAYEGSTGWRIQDVYVSTNRDGKVGIQIMGGANNGVIENVEAPDSSAMAGVIHIDWGFVGSISSNDIAGSRVAFDAGTAYTTHPHNISVRNVKAGTLSRVFTTAGTGADVVRISGGHNITVENVKAKSVTESGFIHTAGDLGYEFALAAVKPQAHRGIRVSNFHVEQANKGTGFLVDCYADNIDAAGGYTEVLDVRAECDILLEHCSTRGDGSTTALAGFKIRHARGVVLRNCDAREHLYGVLVEEGADRVRVEGGRFWKASKDNIYIGNSTNPPEDCEVIDTFCDQAGQDASYTASAGIKVEDSSRTKLLRNKLGANGLTTEATQDHGIYCTNAVAVAVDVRDNYVNACAGSGAAYVMGASTDYTTLWLFTGNGVASGVTTKYGGQNLIPVERRLGPDGVTRRVMTCAKASLTTDVTPTTGAFLTGETIWLTDAASGAHPGSYCTAGGSPGTWKAFSSLA